MGSSGDDLPDGGLEMSSATVYSIQYGLSGAPIGKQNFIVKRNFINLRMGSSGDIVQMVDYKCHLLQLYIPYSRNCLVHIQGKNSF